MAKSLKVKIENFRIGVLGATLELEDYDGIDRYEEFIIAIAGPVLNLLIGFFAYITFKNYNIFFCKAIVEINITLGLLNLLPAYPLDGAKLLRCILSKFSLYKNANRFMVYSSYFIAIIIIGLGIIFIPQNILNINLVLIGCFLIYVNYENKSIYIVLDQIIKKKVRFKKNKYMLNQVISVYYKEEILSIISYIEKNKFNMFYVLDDNMKFLYEIREDEIFDILKEYGNITLEEYYNKIRV